MKGQRTSAKVLDEASFEQSASLAVSRKLCSSCKEITLNLHHHETGIETGPCIRNKHWQIRSIHQPGWLQARCPAPPPPPLAGAAPAPCRASKVKMPFSIPSHVFGPFSPTKTPQVTWGMAFRQYSVLIMKFCNKCARYPLIMKFSLGDSMCAFLALEL